MCYNVKKPYFCQDLYYTKIVFIRMNVIKNIPDILPKKSSNNDNLLFKI